MLRISAPLEPSPGGRRGSENSHSLVFCTPRNFQQTFQLLSDNWSHQAPLPASEKKHQTWQLSLSPDGRPSCSSKAVIVTKPYPWVGHVWRMETAECTDICCMQADAGVWKLSGVREGLEDWTEIGLQTIWQHQGLLGNRATADRSLVQHMPLQMAHRAWQRAVLAKRKGWPPWILQVTKVWKDTNLHSNSSRNQQKWAKPYSLTKRGWGHPH